MIYVLWLYIKDKYAGLARHLDRVHPLMVAANVTPNRPELPCGLPRIYKKRSKATGTSDSEIIEM